MSTSYTPLLGLALPVQGELSGSWGDTVNNYITNYVDAAVAGALTVTTNTTLTKTTNASLGSTSSQYAIIIASPASANITITAPATSKTYVIINTSATYTVKIVGAGPTTGVTIAVSDKALVAWSGSDFVRVSGVSTGSVSSVALTAPSIFTVSGSPITSSGTLALTYSGTALPVANGGSGATTLTGVLKGNGTSAFTAATTGTDYVAPGTATTFTATQTFNGSSSTFGASLLNANETVNVVASAPSATTNFYVQSGSVQYYTTNAANNWTLNIAFSSGTSMNTALAIGQSVTIAFLATQGSTAYYNSAVQVDGVSVTPKWQGGSAPTSGNASGIDVYSYTVIKTASATYTVLAAQTRFA